MSNFTFKSRVLVGLTLFSMFFGAGNLIFPPFLGNLAGDNILSAMSGFTLTAVAAPILGVIAVAISGGLDTLAGRVSKSFAFIFTLLIYLSIGPMLAIPRTASTSFEMAVTPFITHVTSNPSLFGFTVGQVAQAAYSVGFFALAFILAFKPEKLTQRLGKITGPGLLTLIAILFIATLVHPVGSIGAAQAPYLDHPLFQGFIEGYQTMDTLAALNFGLVIAMNVRALGATDTKTVVSETIKAGLVAGVFLIVVYVILAYMGAQAGGAHLGGENGAQTLSALAGSSFGQLGNIVLGAMFFIACLNTCVGLFSCCANYFRTIIPAIPYVGWLFIFAAVSTVLANMGLTMILKVSIPILLAIYPIALILIVLGLIHNYVPTTKTTYPLTVLFTAVVSIIGALTYAKIPLGLLPEWMSMLPLHAQSLGWVVPALVGFVLSFILRGCPCCCSGKDQCTK